MFAAGTYADRRARLAASVQSGILLFLGNGESPMNYADNTYPFRQDSTWLYHFGIDHPGLAALVDIDEQRTVVFGDDLTLDAIVWTGPQPTIAELAAAAGVAETAPAGALADVLDTARSGGRTIHYLPPYRDEHRLALAGLLGVPVSQVDAGASLDFVRAVVDMRNHKTAEEVAEIERAVDTSVDMHVAAMAMVRPGLRESDIAARVTEIALAAGGGLSFPGDRHDPRRDAAQPLPRQHAGAGQISSCSTAARKRRCTTPGISPARSRWTRRSTAARRTSTRSCSTRTSPRWPP